MTRVSIAAALLGMALLAQACAPMPAVPYHPRALSGGYTERELEPGLWQIEFTGSSTSQRQAVAQGMMLRAAEVALANGASHFEVLARDDDEDFQRVVAPPVYRPCFHYPYPYRSAFRGCGWYWPSYHDTVVGRFETDGIIRLLDAEQAAAIRAEGPRPGGPSRLVVDAAEAAATLRSALRIESGEASEEPQP